MFSQSFVMHISAHIKSAVPTLKLALAHLASNALEVLK